jgi:transcriptional regulator with XRE-family HTH domain
MKLDDTWMTQEQRAQLDELPSDTARVKQKFAMWLRMKFELWAYQNKPMSGRGVAATQADLARVTGLEKQMISQYLLASSLPTREAAAKLADVFGEEVFHRLNYNPEMPKDPMLVEAIEAFMRLNTQSKRAVLEQLKERAEIDSRSASARFARGGGKA